MVQSAADGPHVYLVVVRLCLDKLRRQIERRAYSSARSYAPKRLQLGDSQVTELDAPSIRQKYVETLDIAMNHIPAVHIINC